MKLNRSILKALWLLCCFSALMWWLFAYGFRSDLSEVLKAESQIYLIVIMVVLTVPIGFVWAYTTGLIYYGLEAMGIPSSTGWHLDVLLWWAGFAALGYIQWFLLLPWLIARVRSRQRDKQTEPPAP